MLENLLERLVVDVQSKRQPVGRLVAVLFLAEMKKPRVIAVVGPMEYFAQARINIGAILQCLKLAVRLDAAVLADTQENDAVYGLLNGIIQRRLGKLRIAQRDILRQMFAPRFDFIQENIIDFC